MNNENLYEKYSHIIQGSIEAVERGRIIVGGKKNKLKSHGKICVINCENAIPNNNMVEISHCLKTRIINIQDAGQVKYCISCTRYNRNARRRFRRNALKK